MKHSVDFVSARTSGCCKTLARRSRIAGLVAICWLSSFSAFGQATLPIEVQADLLKTRIVDAFGKGDNESVLSSMDTFRRLGLSIPPPLLFAEAKSAAALGRGERAYEVLVEFMSTGDRKSATYTEALALYASYQDTAHKLYKSEASAMLTGLRADMVRIPGGTFRMGDLSSSKDSVERPVHKVTLTPFLLGKTEVTVAQYRAFVRSSDYKAADSKGTPGCKILEVSSGKYGSHSGKSWREPGFDQSDDYPVVCVNWNDANAFIRWLNKETSQQFRLPSEAEFEFAVRAGTTTVYPWGQDADRACAFGNSADQAVLGIKGFLSSGLVNCNDGAVFTNAVRKYGPNPFGLYDLAGNAWEWMMDCVNQSYVGAPTNGSAWTGGDCARRIIRGGSWGDNFKNLRSAARSVLQSTDRDSTVGFRLAHDLEE